MAKLVVPGLPHHVAQRGNRRQQTIFCDEDYAAYVELTAEWCAGRGVAIWAYGLAPNHIHLIAVPQPENLHPDAICHAPGCHHNAVPVRPPTLQRLQQLEKRQSASRPERRSA